VDAHFEMYYGRARVSSSNAHKLFGSAAAVTKSNPPRDFVHSTSPAAMCRLFGRGVKMCIKNIKGLLLRHTLICTTCLDIF
jgi:hypothetical protein